MSTVGTIIWAAEDPAGREVLAATATALGLTVEQCALREAADRAAMTRAAVIGIEAGPDAAQTLALVADLHTRAPNVTLLVASRDGDLNFVRAAIEAGAGDVLSLPLQNAEVHKALLRALQASNRVAATVTRAPETTGEAVTVCGVRGGLGATTLAVNLAARLVEITSSDVALVDLDLQRGDIASFLNLQPLNSIANFGAAAGQADDLFLSKSLTRHANGVFVLPAPTEIEDADLVGHDEVKRALDLLRLRCRYTVIDTARTITGVTAAAFEVSRHVLVLTDLSVPGVRAARRLFDLIGRLGVAAESLDLVITEAVPGPVGLQDAVQAIGRAPYFVVPRDEATAAEAMNHGAPLNGKPSKLATAMTDLAAKIAGTQPAQKPKPSQLFRRFFTRGQEVH